MLWKNETSFSWHIWCFFINSFLPWGWLAGPKISRSIGAKVSVFHEWCAVVSDCDALCPNPHSDTKNWPKHMPWTFCKMFDYFWIQLCYYRSICWTQKRASLTKNLRIFPNVVLFLVATPLVNTKIDLNAWNKHSVKYFTSFKIRCYL